MVRHARMENHAWCTGSASVVSTDHQHRIGQRQSGLAPAIRPTMQPALIRAKQADRSTDSAEFESQRRKLRYIVARDLCASRGNGRPGGCTHADASASQRIQCFSRQPSELTRRNVVALCINTGSAVQAADCDHKWCVRTRIGR